MSCPLFGWQRVIFQMAKRLPIAGFAVSKEAIRHFLTEHVAPHLVLGSECRAQRIDVVISRNISRIRIRIRCMLEIIQIPGKNPVKFQQLLGRQCMLAAFVGQMATHPVSVGRIVRIKMTDGVEKFAQGAVGNDPSRAVGM